MQHKINCIFICENNQIGTRDNKINTDLHVFVPSGRHVQPRIGTAIGCQMMFLLFVHNSGILVGLNWDNEYVSRVILLVQMDHDKLIGSCISSPFYVNGVLFLFDRWRIDIPVTSNGYSDWTLRD